MFKDWLKKLKVWVLGRVEAALLKKVEELDAYESELADLVKLHVDPDQRTKQVVDFVQEKLTVLVIKAFDSKWFSRTFFDKVELSILDEIQQLDKYEAALAAIVKKHLNPEERAKLVVDYIQQYLAALIKKYIKKI